MIRLTSLCGLKPPSMNGASVFGGPRANSSLTVQLSAAILSAIAGDSCERLTKILGKSDASIRSNALLFGFQL
jgi:hypothetical protein